MEAAAQAYGRPFLLLIDAINETDDPRRWRTEIALLQSEIAQYSPWIVVGLSIRTTYVDIALGDAAPGLPSIDHQGFAGVEEVAAERFFEYFGRNWSGLGRPRVVDVIAVIVVA